MSLNSLTRNSIEQWSALRASRQARRLKIVVVCAVLALIAAACGGNSDADLTDLIEAAGDESGDVRIDLGDLQVDGDEDANNVAVSAGGVDSAFGENIPRPDWLEPWVQLPDGLAINIAINDSNTGERMVQGLVEGGDVETILAQQKAMLEAAGYEALQDSGFFVSAGRPPIHIEAGDTGQSSVGYVYEHSFESEETLRNVYAPVEGTGTLTAWINNEVLIFTGTCELRSNSGQFAADDGTANLTVEQRDSEQDYILGNIVDNADGEFNTWNVLQVGPEGQMPAISVRPDGFQFDGLMIDGTFTSNEFATLEVMCPG